MPALPICKGFAGLNNTVDPARLMLTPENPIIDLTECVNMRIDRTGRGSVRPGQTLLSAGEYHSVWSARGLAFVGEGTDLYRIVRIDADGNAVFTGLRNGLAGSRIDFHWTPLGVYYANGSETGIIRDGISYPWVMSEGARVTSPRTYTGPPIYALHLALFATRMFVTVGNILYFSQPNDYGLFRPASDYYMFPTRITMLIPVAGGMYASDEEKTYFITGNDPYEFVRTTVMETPAMEWSKFDDLVEPKFLGMEGTTGWAGWVSKDGLVYGSPTGDALLMPTLDKIKPPTGFLEGAAVMDRYNCIYNFHQ